MKDLLIIFRAAGNLKLETKQVTATINLLDEGATIPFISRYRKEMTGSLDEVQIKNIRDEVEKLRSLENRREVVLKSIAIHEFIILL